jgi:beta-mannosidase
MMTVGPWKAIRIETYEYRLSDVRVDYDFEDDGFSQVAGRVRGEIISSSKDIAGKMTWTLADADGKIVAAGEEAVAGSTIDFAMKLDDVAAWYPRGYGPQPMYKLSLAFSSVSTETNAGNSQQG